MLGDHTYRDLKVVDIARAAGTSPATFYQYFPDVNTAILALAEEMVVDASATVLALVREGPWKGGAGFDTATAIAGGFISLWERHWPLMRVMELTSAEGDERFRHVRTQLLNQFTVALADVIREMAEARGGVVTTDPMATAGVLVSMLAHVAAHRYGFEVYGIRADDLETSMAHILFTSVTGQKVPVAAL
jgi:AcrR family transcriptional regulator